MREARYSSYLGNDKTIRYYNNYRGGSRTKEAKTQRCYGKLYTDFYKSHNCTEMYTDFHI